MTASKVHGRSRSGAGCRLLSKVPALRFISRPGTDESGNVTIITGLAFTVLLGFAGLGIDASSWYSEKRQMQTAADAAAMAGAYELSRPGADLADVIAAGSQAATRNGYGGSVNISLESGGLAVRAVVSEPGESFLSRLFLDTPPILAASAVARRKRAAICILSLETEAPNGILLQGASHITSPGCRVYVNSTDSAALNLQGAPTLTSLSTCVVGGFSGNAARVSPGVDTGCPPAADPLENLEPPPVGPCTTFNKVAHPGETLTPERVYCGGITAVGGTVTFSPGIYVIKDGGLTFGNTNIIGEDVMFYLTGSVSGVDAAGNGEIRLTGRRSGPHQGLIFYQDRNSAPGVVHTFSGTVNKHYEGTIYLPTADVKFIGAASGATTSPYSIYIARRFSLIGAGNLTINENVDESEVPLPQGIDDERTVALIK